MQRIYHVKHKPKNTLLFVILSYDSPELKILWSDGTYKEREKYSLIYWGNQTVSNKLYPSIIAEDISWTTDNNGMLISPSCAHIGFIFGRIENDEKANLKKYQEIVPIYFKEWLDFVDNEMIVKTEKILHAFEQNCTNKIPENLLRTCVQKINKLDEKHNFITTIERENLYDKLMELSKKYEICEEKAIEIIEKIEIGKNGTQQTVWRQSGCMLAESFAGI